MVRHESSMNSAGTYSSIVSTSVADTEEFRSYREQSFASRDSSMGTKSRSSMNWTTKTRLRRAESVLPIKECNEKEVAKAQHFTNAAFQAYITGQHSIDGNKPERRSHILHSWRRAPLVNHNYDNTGEPFVFSPDSKVMMIWELFLIICVIWTLIVAPFEIAIIEVHKAVEVLDWIVTLMFGMDIVRYFFTAFEQRGTSGVRMVFDTTLITRKYLRNWIIIDLLCATPLDSVHAIFHVGVESGAHTPLQVLRLLRLVRIVKLQRAHILSRMDLPYTAMTVLKCVVLSFVCAHWLSCIWAALSFMQGGEISWLDALIRVKLDLTEEIRQEPMYIYMWSLYYATSLITTVGFGDVTPQTDLECVVCTMGIVLGSVLWAYILSSLLDVLNRMNPHRMDFERTIDELNRMMHDHSLPDALRNDVRHYFYECQDLWKLQRRGALVQRMSRSLKGRVTLALNGEWIQKVSYIRGLFIQGISGSTAFVVEISRKMVPKIFSPGEKLASPVLYIVRKGLIAAGFRLLGVGDVCGEDLILQNQQNRSPYSLIALTMCGTLALSRANFLASLEKFPPQRKAIRTYTMWMALKRGLARELRRQVQKFGIRATTNENPSRPCFFRSISEGHSVEDQVQGHDEDFLPQVATVADLNAAVRNLEALLEKQRMGLTDMINTHMLRRWHGVMPDSRRGSIASSWRTRSDGSLNGYELLDQERPSMNVGSEPKSEAGVASSRDSTISDAPAVDASWATGPRSRSAPAGRSRPSPMPETITPRQQRSRQRAAQYVRYSLTED